RRRILLDPDALRDFIADERHHPLECLGVQVSELWHMGCMWVTLPEFRKGGIWVQSLQRSEISRVQESRLEEYPACPKHQDGGERVVLLQFARLPRRYYQALDCVFDLRVESIPRQLIE